MNDLTPMLVVAAATVAIFRGNGLRPAAAVVDLSLCILLLAVVVARLGVDASLAAAATLVALSAAFASLRGRLRSPVAGWVSLAGVAVAACDARTLPSLTLAVAAGTLLAAAERSRIDRKGGRLLLLSHLLFDLPLAMAIVLLGPRLPEAEWILRTDAAAEAAFRTEPIWTFTAVGLAMAGTVRMLLMPFASWLLTRRPPGDAATGEAIDLSAASDGGAEPQRFAIAIAATAIVPCGFTLLERFDAAGSQAEFFWLPVSAMLMASAVLWLLTAAVNRDVVGLLGLTVSLLPVALLFNARVATASEASPDRSLIGLIAGLMVVGTAVPSILGGLPAVRSRRVDLRGLAAAMATLPLGFASHLVRFLDWAAIRQTLVRLPTRGPLGGRSLSTAAWVGVFVAATLAMFVAT